jgi:hypothetical protein
MGILTQTHQILMVRCPVCGGDFAIARHSAEELVDLNKTIWLFDSDIGCGNDDCSRRGFGSSEVSMVEAMQTALQQYRTP